MIIDTPFLGNLAIGADRVIPEFGDGQVVIPSTISPVVPPLYAHDISTALTDRTNTSKMLSASNTRINVAAISQNIITLPRGLYVVEFNFAVRANFTTLVLNEVTTIGLTYQGQSVILAALAVNTGTGNVEGRRELLLTSDAVFTVVVPATNAIATNSIAWTLGLNVIRRI